jgi:hypothetical protein
MFIVKIDCSPQNAKEFYNLCHVSLRNAVECIFDVLKKRFQIVTETMEYSFEIQVCLVKALCCIHNIIQMISGDDIYDELWMREDATELHRPTDIDSIGDHVNSKVITTVQERCKRGLLI